MPRLSDHEITALLDSWSAGDPEALDRLMPLVFEDIREIAQRAFRREPTDHTLQPTALVHEVYLRLTGLRTVQWTNRAQFFGTLAHIMRRILVDRARRHQAAKRGAGIPVLPLDEALLPDVVRPADLVALDDALDALADLDPRKHQVVVLKFFIGLTREEIAELLGVATSTVIRDWANARAWLLRELAQRSGADAVEVGGAL